MAELTTSPRLAPGAYIGLAVVAALAGLNAWVLTTPLEVTPLASSGVILRKPEPGLQAVRSRDDFGLIEKITTRPLFNPDRKPLVRAETATAAAPAELSNLELVGVREDTAGRRKALIRWSETNPAAWVAAGQEIEGWRVARIEPTRVIVEGGAGRIELQLYRTR